ncbi:T9SS type B sorting domain-containing protein [bacterium]|nr:T9SS type B sorting domain-containing protein [bacterium]
MVRTLRLFLLMAFAWVLSPTLHASHIMGGEIWWDCLPNGQYRIKMKIYRDCNGITLTGNENISVRNYNGGTLSIPMPLITMTDVSPDCAPWPGAQTIACGAFTGSNGNGDGAVQENYYESAPVTLTGTPTAAGWVFTWTSCCRNSAVDNITGAGGTGHTLRAIMYPYVPPGGTAPNAANPCYDSSPRFTESPSTVICTGYPFTYNHNASDPELDSIYYRWADPLDDLTAGTGWNPPVSPNTVSWATGYSSTSPLPGPTVNPLNVPANLDQLSGQVSYTCHTPGSYVTCIAVEAWKCGQRVAEIYRDIQITLLGCTEVNNKPVLTMTPSPGSVPITQNGFQYSATAYAGDLVAFTLNAADYDLTPVTFGLQTIQFQATGGQLGVPITNAATGCLNPPCATISPGPGNGGSFSAVANNTVIFNWDTDCNHLAVSNGCGSFQNTYTFAMRMQDNFCPAPAISIATLKVTVLADPSDPPVINCAGIATNGDINLSWTPPADTGFQFNYYIIYYKPDQPANAVFAPVDTVYGYSTAQAVLTGLANNGDGLYYMRVNTQCDYLSNESDTVGIMFMNMTPLPPTSSSFAVMNWTPIGSGVTNYEIWAEVPQNSNNWVQVGSTTDTAYIDTASFCGAFVNYQVRVPINGSYCGSNLDSGYFSDNTNDDIMVIDSISVVGSQAAISFGASTSDDVTDYYLLQWNANLGQFDIIDTIPVGTPMPYVIPTSVADTRSETYKVISTDSCGNQSDDLSVVRHRTILLKNYLDKCSGNNNLTWTEYKGFNVHEYRVMVEITPPGGFTNTVLLNSQSETDSSYLHLSLQNGYTYCYYVRAVDTVQNLSAVSNRICLTADVPNKSRLLYLGKASNTLDAIDLVTYIDGTADVINFTYERADNPVGPYLPIGTVPKPAQPPYVLLYTDYGADADNRMYWYRVSALDSCGARDTVSNIARNIFLQVDPLGGATNFLRWNPYEDWGGVVGTYTIYRAAQEGYGFVPLTTVPGTDTSYYDYIDPSISNEGRFCYYVVAEEQDNPLGFVDVNGEAFKSQSNQDCAVHEARVFLPSAFNPNSPFEENRWFGPSKVFGKERKNYRFYILNRWGELMFDSDKPGEKWDGTYQGNEAPIGVYQYYLKYQSLESVPVEQRGFFTLIR